MASFTKVLLSGSTNGRPIAVTQTASPGDTVHTVPSGTSTADEIWLWAVNNGAATAVLTVEFGGTSASDKITISLDINTPSLVITGIPLQNSTVVKIYSSGTINVYGYVNRITF